MQKQVGESNSFLLNWSLKRFAKMQNKKALFQFILESIVIFNDKDVIYVNK